MPFSSQVSLACGGPYRHKRRPQLMALLLSGDCVPLRDGAPCEFVRAIFLVVTPLGVGRTIRYTDQKQFFNLLFFRQILEKERSASFSILLYQLIIGNLCFSSINQSNNQPINQSINQAMLEIGFTKTEIDGIIGNMKTKLFVKSNQD